MRRADSTLQALRWHILVGAWVCLCLSFLGSVAQASSTSMQQAVPMVSAMPSHSMPQAMDCAECVRCFIAPARPIATV